VSPPPRVAAVTLGTRGSALARAQAELVADALRAAWPGIEVRTTALVTAGDRSQAEGRPLPEIGGKGLFTEELERALLAGEIDLAVHSLKDLPTDASSEVAVGAVLEREDASDCLVSREGLLLTDLGAGAVVGTSSLRRGAQLHALRRDLDVRSIRGNVDTRIRKVREGDYDAVVLASAGVRRLGLHDEVTEWLSSETMLPAPGQGALAVQSRAGDGGVLELLAPLDDAAARAETSAERGFLGALGGGCAAPVAARAVAEGARVRMDGLVASVDGSEVVRVHGTGEPSQLAERLAREALEAGADRILAALRA
jgi:hydroxymethylbilane synthase